MYEPTVAFQITTFSVPPSTQRVCSATPHKFDHLLLSQGSSDTEGGDEGWGTKETSKDKDAAPVEPLAGGRQSTPTTKEEEPDLFIPIFALVSILGFAGLYGYEMIRLYLRGELYLPF